jgi:peroxiredoxin
MAFSRSAAALTLLTLATVVVLLWPRTRGLERAPDISVATLDGRHLSIASLRGHPVLVNFWATSCPGCLKELPQLRELYQDFAPRGLHIIGIAMAYDRPDYVVAFSRERHIPYPIALDIDSDAARAFGGIEVTPTTFLVAPDGHIAQHTRGPLDVARVRGVIAGMITAHDSTRLSPEN